MVEKLVANGEAAAAGRLCVAAIQMGPEQADAVRRIAVQLIASGSAATLATLGAAFWHEAATAGSDAGAAAVPGTPGSPGGASHGGLATPHKRAARSLAEAALSELTAGRAALDPGQPGSPIAAAAAAAPADEIQPAGSPPSGAAPVQPAAPPEPEADVPAGPVRPSSGELQAAAAVVFAAAAVDAVGQGHAATMVEVTQLLLEAGQHELVAALVATMVEAGEAGRSSRYSRVFGRLLAGTRE